MKENQNYGGDTVKDIEDRIGELYDQLAIYWDREIVTEIHRLEMKVAKRTEKKPIKKLIK